MKVVIICDYAISIGRTFETLSAATEKVGHVKAKLTAAHIPFNPSNDTNLFICKQY